MMKFIKYILLFLLFVSVSACFEDIDDNFAEVGDINDFVWRGMNGFYVYKDEIPDLSNDRFNTRAEYSSFLNSFNTPEGLFESLIYQRNTVDRFSDIVPNFVELQQTLQGTRLTSGMNYGLRIYPGENTNVFGYVRYVVPGSPADAVGIQRGTIFNAVDGEQLTVNNFRELLIDGSTVFTLNFANYDDNGTPDDTTDDSVTSTGEETLLAKTSISENPIHFANIYEVDGKKVGYLMYNGFRLSNISLAQLNGLFDLYRSEGVTDFVLDLRYNGGGFVDTAIWLSSMLTGQFTGDLLFKEQWNDGVQAILESESPEVINNNFVDEIVIRNGDDEVIFQQNINSLNLNELYVITTRSTASASELVINCLSPYINVVQIGTPTQGKPQASFTLYDSENFRPEGANPSHTYAIQPLVYEASNASGFSSYYNGLNPTEGFEQAENYGDLGIIGNINEPLLSRALQAITGNTRSALSFPKEDLESIEVNPRADIMLDNSTEKLKEILELYDTNSGN